MEVDDLDVEATTGDESGTSGKPTLRLVLKSTLCYGGIFFFDGDRRPRRRSNYRRREWYRWKEDTLFPHLRPKTKKRKVVSFFLESASISPARKKTSDQTYSDSISTLSIRFH